MRFGIVVFPGTHSEQDVRHVVEDVLGQEARLVWHRDRDLEGLDCVILPGGSSFGDALRPGALASRSPVMEEVASFAKKGGKVVGIGNGFQILLEAGLLPGTTLQNRSLRFLAEDVFLQVANADTVFTRKISTERPLRLPLATGFGSYFLADEPLQRLEDGGQVVFRYAEADGRITDAADPIGARNNIAGIVNEEGNVLGMMPHPERLAERILGGDDGLRIFESLLAG